MGVIRQIKSLGLPQLNGCGVLQLFHMVAGQGHITRRHGRGRQNKPPRHSCRQCASDRRVFSKINCDGAFFAKNKEAL
jgi:hypothetical protein